MRALPAGQLESQGLDHGLDVQMSHFIDEFLTPNVKAVLDDPRGEELGGRPCQAVLRKHYARLEKVFSAYAAADKVQSSKKGSKARKEEQATINDAEWGQMLDDAKLIDKMFTLREATMIFVKVNLQDELFHASDQSSFDSAMECTYDEFQLNDDRPARAREGAGEWRALRGDAQHVPRVGTAADARKGGQDAQEATSGGPRSRPTFRTRVSLVRVIKATKQGVSNALSRTLFYGTPLSQVTQSHAGVEQNQDTQKRGTPTSHTSHDSRVWR